MQPGGLRCRPFLRSLTRPTSIIVRAAGNRLNNFISRFSRRIRSTRTRCICLDCWRIRRAKTRRRSRCSARPSACTAQPPIFTITWARPTAPLGRYPEAAAAYQQAIRLYDNFAEAHNNLGTIFQRQGHFEDALKCFDRAIACRPDYANAHSNRALTWLTMGNFEQGWAEHEWLMEASGVLSPRMASACLGRVTTEWPHVADPSRARLGRHAAIRSLSVPARPIGRCGMVRTAARSYSPAHTKRISGPDCPQCRIAIIRRADDTIEPSPPPSYDARVSSRGDALFIGRSRASGPVARQTSRRDRVQGRHPLARKSAVAARALAFDSIGLVQSVGQHSRSAARQLAKRIRRRANPADRRPVRGTRSFPGTRQRWRRLHGYRRRDVGVRSNRYLGFGHCHLAGALGRPAWVAPPRQPIVRWLHGRTDSPWYPTMRLFRQPRHTDWAQCSKRSPTS